MRPSSTARRYAEAAFEVARQDGDTGQWLVDLQSVVDALKDPNFGLYLKDPAVGSEHKLRTIRRAFAHLRPHVLNLLLLLTSKERAYLMPQVLAEFEALDREARGIAEAYVTLARPVSDVERADITNRLAGATGKTIEIHAKVDPSILGGIIVRIGDRLIDASVSGRLQRLRQELV